jgi:poly-beta-1,6-N-acetyl-D-glucosamine synthase
MQPSTVNTQGPDSAARRVRYVIITPARNEGRYLQKTIESIRAQTLRPEKWVIVNDGSTDDTRQIIDAAMKQHSWILAVHRPDRGFRKAGGGVIEAFYDGYRLVAGEPWDFLVKLDGDLSFETGFFARSVDHFYADPKLGIGGGTICGDRDGVLVEEATGDPAFHVRGATKIYRRACWESIGGLLQAPGWDTLDEIKANMSGWRTYTFRELQLHHHRHTGGADGSWRDWTKNGMANYITGYHPVFMFFKCLKRAFSEASLTAPAALGWGFLSGYLKRVPRTEPAVIRYVRREQVKRLMFRPSLWS